MEKLEGRKLGFQGGAGGPKHICSHNTSFMELKKLKIAAVLFRRTDLSCLVIGLEAFVMQEKMPCSQFSQGSLCLAWGWSAVTTEAEGLEG
jgi:hypothetical protein